MNLKPAVKLKIELEFELCALFFWTRKRTIKVSNVLCARNSIGFTSLCFFVFLVNTMLFVVSKIWTNNKTEVEECKSYILGIQSALAKSQLLWNSPYRRKCNCCAHAGTFETPTTMQCIWQTITRIRCQCSIETFDWTNSIQSNFNSITVLRALDALEQ